VHDKDLYATILGVTSPWLVREVEVRAALEEVEVFIKHDGGTELVCPECGEAGKRYDARQRSWRHLDTCQYRTILTADVPRVKCKEHGVRQVKVPWAEEKSRFTAMLESLAIDWLQEASISGVSRRMGLSWDELDGIRERAVRRGLLRREAEPVAVIGVDETAFQRRHEYVTVVNDLRRSRVLYVGDGRGSETLEAYYEGLTPEQLEGIIAIAMDMWRPYVRATREHVDGWETRVCFDRFHVAKYLGDAVNDVRKAEHKELLQNGDDRLKRTRFLWLMGPDKLDRLNDRQRVQFDELKASTLRVARAWAIKETARELWGYVRRDWALRAWERWLVWAFRSKLEPIRKAARVIQNNLWGIINAAVKNVTNATSESLNAKIQWVKKNACGFRNRDRFRTAILFHCGGLDLYPDTLFHTKS
jgi:transposase